MENKSSNITYGEHCQLPTLSLPNDYHQAKYLLGLIMEEKPTLENITTAYLALAEKHHPSVHHHPDCDSELTHVLLAEKNFEAICHAIDLLLENDPRKISTVILSYPHLSTEEFSLFRWIEEVFTNETNYQQYRMIKTNKTLVEITLQANLSEHDLQQLRQWLKSDNRHAKQQQLTQNYQHCLQRIDNLNLSPLNSNANIDHRQQYFQTTQPESKLTPLQQVNFWIGSIDKPLCNSDNNDLELSTKTVNKVVVKL